MKKLLLFLLFASSAFAQKHSLRIQQQTGIATGQQTQVAVTPKNALDVLGFDANKKVAAFSIGGIQHASVTLTPTQIKAMNTTPVVILAAPGVGKTNVLVGPVILKYTFGTAAYTSGGAIVIQYTTGTVAATGTTAGSRLGAASTTSVAVPIAALPSLNDTLEITNGTGVFVGSTAVGTLTIDFDYRVL